MPTPGTPGLTGLRAVTAVPGARRLFAASLVGRLPEGMESLALLLFFRHAYESYATAGMLVALFSLSGAGLSLVVGPWVARWGAARVVACCAVVQSLALAGLLLAVGRTGPTWAAVALVILGGLFGPPVAACARAAWRDAAPTAGVREAGYTLDAVLQELVWMAGPALVTTCLLLVGTEAPVAVIAVLVVLGASYFVTSPLVGQVGSTVRTSLVEAPRSASLRGLPTRVQVLLVACVASGVGFGATEVGVPALADALDAPGAAGVLLAAMSCGSIVSGLSYGSRTWRSSVTVRHALAAMALGLLTCTLIGASSLPTALVLAFLAGAPWSPLLASQYAAFAEATPEAHTVTVFTWSSTAVVIGVAAGAAVSGWLVDHVGTDAVFLLAGAAFVGVGLLVVSQVRQSSVSQPPR